VKQMAGSEVDQH